LDRVNNSIDEKNKFDDVGDEEDEDPLDDNDEYDTYHRYLFIMLTVIFVFNILLKTIRHVHKICILLYS
jgi:hypothetical protein